MQCEARFNLESPYHESNNKMLQISVYLHPSLIIRVRDKVGSCLKTWLLHILSQFAQRFFCRSRSGISEVYVDSFKHDRGGKKYV